MNSVWEFDMGCFAVISVRVCSSSEFFLGVHSGSSFWEYCLGVLSGNVSWDSSCVCVCYFWVFFLGIHSGSAVWEFRLGILSGSSVLDFVL